MVEDYKKIKEFTDVALDVMNEEIARYLHMLVDKIKEVDPKFPLTNYEPLVISWHTYVNPKSLDNVSLVSPGEQATEKGETLKGECAFNSPNFCSSFVLLFFW